MDAKKWAKGLTKELIEKILLEIEPDEVFYYHKMPEITVFIIEKGIEVAIGISICSPIDACSKYFEGGGFSARKGKIQAAGRAVKAFLNKRNALPIRYEDYPNSWNKRQIDLLNKVGEKWGYKSIYRITIGHKGSFI